MVSRTLGLTLEEGLKDEEGEEREGDALEEGDREGECPIKGSWKNAA